MGLAGVVMACVIAVSLGWALRETATSPTWAYFDTFARVWELGVGALLATAVGPLARIPVAVKPWLSWAGLGLIAASLLLITENSIGFPAPWALLPVAGSAMVIAAGVKQEPLHQAFLRNEVAVYIGNISYSLYLVHWPVIVILGSVIRSHDSTFYIVAIALTFGLAIASYHFVENPLRYADRDKADRLLRSLRQRRFEPQRSTRDAALAVLGLATVALTAYAISPPLPALVPAEAAATTRADGQQPALAPGPPGAEVQQLQAQIREALTATEWPILDPPLEMLESATNRDSPDVKLWYSPDIVQCSSEPNPQTCTWGSPSAPVRVMLVGDSIALSYAEPLRAIALNSGGRIQLRLEAMAGCRLMVNYMDDSAGQKLMDDCLAVHDI